MKRQVPRDHLHLMSLGVDTALQLRGGVIGDDAVTPQAGGGPEAVDDPFASVRMLGHRDKDAPRDTADVAGSDVG